MLDNQQSTRNLNQFRKRQHPWLPTILILFLVLISFGLLFGKTAYNTAQTSFKETYQPGLRYKSRNTSELLQERKPVSILLLGTDTGALGRNDKGRTDTMIVATVNPSKNKISLTSIPRDTKLQNIRNDDNHPDKINNAYTVGGASDAVSTVQHFLHIPIDYYALINMGGLEKMVNAVGGVKVTPKLSFHYGACHVTKGKTVVLNGKQALDYCRMRHQDPRGDYGRQSRQRDVIKELVFKGMQISSLPRYKAILSSLHGNLLTDISFSDMMTMRVHYAHATRHLQSDDIAEQGEMDDGVSYQVPSNKELAKISREIKANLEI